MTSLSRMLTVSCHNLFAFDGTGNGKSSYTNVYLLYESHGGSALGKYYSGVGTDDYTDSEGVFSQIRQAFSRPDITLKINKAMSDYNTLKWSSTEDVCIDVVGFSRGAVTAVEFVRKLRDQEQDMATRVRFLGLFDPVTGPDTSTSPRLPINIDHVAIAYSLDETRNTFTPVIYEAPSGYAMDLVRYAFRGGHADVGGGYAKRGLANITFDFMFEAGKSVGVPFKPLSRTFMDTMKHSKIDGEFITHEMMWHQEYPAYNVKYEARHLPAAIKRHWIVNELKAPSGPGNAFEYKKKKIFMPYHN